MSRAVIERMGRTGNDPAVQAEIQHIENALLTVDRATIARYDGVKGITKRLRELKDLPRTKRHRRNHN